jgi:F-type H+-transporting ATPase subunit epsilon
VPIRCEIVSQDRLVFEGDADMIIVPGILGEMGILPKHAPLLSTLKMGVLRVRTQGREEDFTVSGGVIEVQPDLVTILADAAENVMEIDVARAEAARRRAEEMLDQGTGLSDDSYIELEAALKRSSLRLEAVKRFRGQSRSYGMGSKEEA